MSLRDELMKAGLVSTERAKQLEADTRKQGYQHKKGQAAAEDAARQAEIRQQAAADAARKRERDRRLNEEREAEKRRREQQARARQLLDAHRLNEPDAEILYHFPEGRVLRSVRVTPAQRTALATGRMAVARGDRHEFDYPLVSRDIAQKLTECAPERVLLLYPESNGIEDEEDWGE
ncbi:MAG: DUF2058 family protein [Candidatus Competibacteraceae bacterium]|jgi:uncharacterized protein|nr:MAG: DUF2058 family protein [Candidatus Competibacteraceae bacterium]